VGLAPKGVPTGPGRPGATNAGAQDRLSVMSVHSRGVPRLTGGRRLLREVGLALVTAGVVVLLFVAYELVGTSLTEEHSQSQLARAFNAAVAAARPALKPATTSPGGHGGASGHGPPGSRTTKGVRTSRPPRATASGHAKGSTASGTAAGATGSSPVPPPGGALDHMVIPAIGVDRYVVEGVAELDLQMGPGHYPGTPLPGQDGNVGIAGHRTTFGAPFFRLNELVPGDFIYLTDTSGATWVYDVVRQWVVPPSDTAVLGATHRPELTLTTCNPRFEATTRLVVRADLVKRLPRGTPLTGGLPASAPGRATAEASGTPRKAPRRVLSPTTGHSATSSTVPLTAGAPGASSTSTTAPGPPGQGPGRPGADLPTVGPVAAAASSGSGGGGAWAGALGWGALALLVWALTRVMASRRYRYAKLGVLVCGALVCLVPLWFSFSNVVDLLPANL
jgi:sortase A